MLLTTQDKFEDRDIEKTLGLIMGNTVRARHVFSDIGANLRNIVGGEARGYTKLASESRQQALDRLIEEARKLRADGIVGMRFTSNHLAAGMNEIIAYGTAVTLKK